jgi:hypothetical protein
MAKFETNVVGNERRYEEISCVAMKDEMEHIVRSSKKRKATDVGFNAVTGKLELVYDS